ncbi:MAG: hypothetical protein JW836_00060 [Deltaproteobacteria bacterium]|nr:hypothetical protein [Deltaproteobacteria bacterium]
METIAAGLEENGGNHLDELAEDPLVLRVLPDYLAELEQARQEVMNLEQEKEAFEAGENEDGSEDDQTEEGERRNYARELKDQIRELKHSIKEYQKLIKTLTGSSKKAGSITFHKAKGQDIRGLEGQLEELEEKVEPAEKKILELEMKLKLYDEILEKLKAAKKQLKDLQRKFVKRLKEAREALSEEECRELVLNILKEKLEGNLDAYVAAHRQKAVAAVENWWDKYREPMKNIEDGRNATAKKVSRIFSELGYA